MIERQLHTDAFFQIRSRVDKNTGGNRRLFKGFIVHEIVKITIGIKVIYILEIQRNILNTVSGSECPFECCSGAEVAGFDTNGCVTAA